MSKLLKLVGPQITTKNGTVDAANVIGDKKLVGLYCSAHWCPPCRAFTPVLAEQYKSWRSTPEGSDLEIVFVSSDREPDAFKKYFAEQPWTAIPYANRDEKDNISRQFQVMSIPSFIILDQAGNVVDREGRNTVMQKKSGALKYWSDLAASKQ